MILLVQFGINKHLLIFFKVRKLHSLRARTILLVFEKIYSCLFIPNCTRNHVITYTNMPWTPLHCFVSFQLFVSFFFFFKLILKF